MVQSSQVMGHPGEDFFPAKAQTGHHIDGRIHRQLSRLNALEGRGLIRREPDPNDGRSTAVSLTREGKRLVEEILPEHVANEQRLTSELSTKNRTELAGLLEMLAISLGDEAATRGPRTTVLRRRRGG